VLEYRTKWSLHSFGDRQLRDIAAQNRKELRARAVHVRRRADGLTGASCSVAKSENAFKEEH